MNIKNALKYCIYLFMMIALYYIGSTILAKHYEEANITFMYNYWLITVVKIIFFGGIGIVLGLDKFLSELYLKGKWKLDISKLIVLGIPTFIFSMPYIVLKFIEIPTLFSSVFIISNIVLGHTLISSLYREY